MHSQIQIGNVAIGRTPCVVGVASRLSTLENATNAAAACDVMEVRRDLIGVEAAAWLRAKSAQVPVLLTIRADKEGGKWADTEAARVAEYLALLPLVDAVDVELESDAFARVAAAAREAKRTVIGSFHDFRATPDAARLRALIDRGIHQGADIVKIAAWTSAEDDVARLESLLQLPFSAPLAVMGMGPLGAPSRLRLAAAGSCLVYGFLDEESAPGQLSAAELRRRLRPA